MPAITGASRALVAHPAGILGGVDHLFTGIQPRATVLTADQQVPTKWRRPACWGWERQGVTGTARLDQGELMVDAEWSDDGKTSIYQVVGGA